MSSSSPPPPPIDFAHQVYGIVDEVFLAGEIMETSKEKIITRVSDIDKVE